MRRIIGWLLRDGKARAASSRRFGGYSIQRTIHEGEKAVVYEATMPGLPAPQASPACASPHADRRQAGTGRRVVVKAYKPVYDRTVRRMRRKYGLLSEGEIGMRMNAGVEDDPATYPVVRTLDQGHEYGRPRNPYFVVVEYIEGSKLKSLIATEDPDLPSVRLHLCRRGARALEIIHSRNMVHRDVCSDNFLVSPQWQAKLIDLGFCVPAGVEFAEKTGTPSYMAPEQIRAEPLTPQTDIYAFGVVMYEMFTGRLPFASGLTGKGDRAQSAREAETMSQHLRALPPRPRDVAPDVSPQMEQVILKCLEKRPEQRFASAAELIQELGLLRE